MKKRKPVRNMLKFAGRLCYSFSKGVTKMIEIVYEKEKQKPEGNEAYFRVPNNIRQIGEIHETQKIYIEDYAYTYLCRISDKYQKEGCAAILLGQANYKNGISYLFIKSAIGLLDLEVSEDHLQLGEEAWNYVYEKNQEYFQGQEVVGWCLSLPGCLLEPNNLICKTHLDHFGGKEKVLFLMESLEKEEAFFRYEEGGLNRLEGFYIYYEKNLPMQNYLVDENKRKDTKSEQVEDHAVKTFRKKIENKAEVQRERKNTSFSGWRVFA